MQEVQQHMAFVDEDYADLRETARRFSRERLLPFYQQRENEFITTGL